MPKQSRFKRRDLLKTGAAAAAAGAAAAALPGRALANRHGHPNPGSIGYLDRNQYVSNCEIVAQYNFPGSDGERVGTGGKTNMIAIGNRRYLYMGSTVFDVTEPRNVSLVTDQAPGGNLQVAYNRNLKKWILLAGRGAPSTSATAEYPNGKYDDPSMRERAIAAKGLRGISIYDITDPTNPQHYADWACDGGDPSREVQEGGGTHRNWYGGGRYACLDTSSDNTFTNMENPYRHYNNHIQVIDIADPMKPKLASNWWFPGQTTREMDEFRKSRFYGDRLSWTCTHGPMVMPLDPENGGRYGYTAYGSYGMTIHDISDPTNIRLVGLFDPKPHPGAIPFHTVDCSRVLDHGVVITTAETLNPDCNEVYQDGYIVDVRDPTNPTLIARMPRHKPPEEAPYKSFCQKRGRYGVHNPPHHKAPGKANRNFIATASFNGGLQLIDITRFDAPRIVGWHIPPQEGSLDRFGSWNRDSNNLFVEWDRNLIWHMTTSGMYLVTTPALGTPVLEPREVTEWALPVNQGHSELTG